MESCCRISLRKVVDGIAARLQLALEFVLGVGALEFGEFVLDFAVGGLQTQFLRLLQQDLIVDQFVEDIQLQR